MTSALGPFSVGDINATIGQKRTLVINVMDAKEISLLKAALLRMAMLLDNGGFPTWAASFKQIQAELVVDSASAVRTLRGMFGGMGSLNDIVLQTSEGASGPMNSEFDKLRSDLYRLISA